MASPPLSPDESAALEFLARGNAGMRRVVDAVVARQARSLEVHARAREALSGGPSQLPYEAPLLPVCVARAEGSRIVDLDGHEYVDGHMCYTADVLGHSPAPVVEAVRRALDRGVGGGHLVEEQVELAELVKGLVPGVERVALFHTGGEALAAAVRLARAVTGRPRVAKFEGCYHGSNDLGLHNSWMILSGRPPMDPPDAIRPWVATGGTRTDDSFVILPFNAPEALSELQRHASELACVVIDPFPDFMSNWPEDSRRFTAEVCDVAAAAEVPVVFDEVVCGFRVARGGAREWVGRTPQMSCFGKVTSGAGLPLSILAGEARFVDYVRTAGLFRDYMPPKAWVTSTLNSNAVAVAASLAQLRHLSAHHDSVLAALDGGAEALRESLADVARRTGIAVSLQGHPRTKMQISVGKQEPAERTYRGLLASASPAQFRVLLGLTLYLRLEGVYAKVIPTMNLSAAHTAKDLARVVAAVEASVGAMRSDGLIEG